MAGNEMRARHWFKIGSAWLRGGRGQHKQYRGTTRMMTEEEEKVVDSSDSTFAVMPQINNDNGASDESRFSESDDDDDDDDGKRLLDDNGSVTNSDRRQRQQQTHPLSQLLSQIVIGTKLEVYWPSMKKYYPGSVVAHDESSNNDCNNNQYVFRIRYDDGDELNEDLSVEQFYISIGTKIEIYWPNDNKFYPGIVAAHVVNDICPHKYMIKYDDDDEEKLDLSKERFRIVVNDNVEAARSVTPPDDNDKNANKSQTTLFGTKVLPQVGNGDDDIEKYPVGQRIPDAGPPYDFIANDAGYEILFDNNEYWQYCPNKEKITFYSVSFSTMSCEVEWNNNGIIYNTTFRKVGPRKRKKVDKSITSAADDMPKKKRCTASNKKFKSIEQEATSSKPTKVSGRRIGAKKEISSNSKSMTKKRNSNARHYITDELKTTREDILSTLPEGMTSMFHDCCWVLW